MCSYDLADWRFAEGWQPETLMQAILVLGLVCIVAAIVGGGLKAFGIELPQLNSTSRQILLGLFGTVLVIVYLSRGSPDEGKPIGAEAANRASAVDKSKQQSAAPQSTPAKQSSSASPAMSNAAKQNSSASLEVGNAVKQNPASPGRLFRSPTPAEQAKLISELTKNATLVGSISDALKLNAFDKLMLDGAARHLENCPNGKILIFASNLTFLQESFGMVASNQTSITSYLKVQKGVAPSRIDLRVFDEEPGNSAKIYWVPSC